MYEGQRVAVGYVIANEAMDAARTGESDLELAVRQHARLVYRIAYSVLRNHQDAEDATQETFIRAFAQLGRFRGESALSTWLHRVTLSVVSNAMRKVKRFRAREADLDEATSIAAETRRADPDLRDKLHRAIDELPEIYRITLVMHDVEGYTHEEIANVLGVAEGTCKSRLSVARAQLREKLAPYAKEWLE